VDGWMDKPSGWMKFELAFFFFKVLDCVNHNICSCYFSDEKFQGIGIWMNFLGIYYVVIPR
jgi:hypothetical protein